MNEEFSLKQVNSKYTWKRTITPEKLEKFKNELEKISWNDVMSSSEPQFTYSLLHNKFLNVYNKCLPLKKKIINNYSSRLPWLTESLKMSISTKNRLYKKQKKSQDLYDIAQYKNYKNRLSKVLKSAERAHYAIVIEEHKSDLQKSWNILKNVLNRNKSTYTNTRFKYNDSIIENREDISNKFNEIFVNLGSNLANKIPNHHTTPKIFLKKRVVESIFIEPIIEMEVLSIIKRLKNGAAGWDGIHARVLRTIKSIIVKPLTHVLNLSFISGIFPSELKVANVVPIFKSGDGQIFTNYRPVSVLPVFSKILERLMYNRLLSFLNKHKIIYDYQFGFREKYSTYLALIKLTEKKLVKHLMKGKMLLVFF